MEARLICFIGLQRFSELTGWQGIAEIPLRPTSNGETDMLRISAGKKFAWNQAKPRQNSSNRAPLGCGSYLCEFERVSL
jgi:hypothetical protein